MNDLLFARHEKFRKLIMLILARDRKSYAYIKAVEELYNWLTGDIMNETIYNDAPLPDFIKEQITRFHYNEGLREQMVSSVIARITTDQLKCNQECATIMGRYCWKKKLLPIHCRTFQSINNKKRKGRKRRSR